MRHKSKVCPFCAGSHIKHRKVKGWVCYDCKVNFEAPVMFGEESRRQSAGSGQIAERCYTRSYAAWGASED